MENKKILIFILDEKEKKYSLEVEKIISCENLKKRIILKFHKKDNFYIVFKKKTLNNEDIITFNEGDMIYLIEYKDYKTEKETEEPEKRTKDKRRRRSEDKKGVEDKEYLGKKREYKKAKKIIKPKKKPAKKAPKKRTKKITKKLINIRFFENEDYNSEISGSDIALDLDLNQLNGILNLCLINIHIMPNFKNKSKKKLK